MAFRIKLPGGMLKVKTYRELRATERDRRVPVRKLGRFYFIWWADQQKSSQSSTGGPSPDV